MVFLGSLERHGEVINRCISKSEIYKIMYEFLHQNTTGVLKI